MVLKERTIKIGPARLMLSWWPDGTLLSFALFLGDLPWARSAKTYIWHSHLWSLPKSFRRRYLPFGLSIFAIDFQADGWPSLIEGTFRSRAAYRR
jgi:hypothetical protein